MQHGADVRNKLLWDYDSGSYIDADPVEQRNIRCNSGRICQGQTGLL